MKTSEVGTVNKFIPEEEATHTAGAWEERQCFWKQRCKGWTSAGEMNGGRVRGERALTPRKTENGWMNWNVKFQQMLLRQQR